jgi:hypothetical protein
MNDVYLTIYRWQERQAAEKTDEKYAALVQGEAQLQQQLTASKTEQTTLRRQVTQLEKKLASQKQQHETSQQKVRKHVVLTRVCIIVVTPSFVEFIGEGQRKRVGHCPSAVQATRAGAQGLRAEQEPAGGAHP